MNEYTIRCMKKIKQIQPSPLPIKSNLPGAKLCTFLIQEVQEMELEEKKDDSTEKEQEGETEKKDKKEKKEKKKKEKKEKVKVRNR